jgi:hypothetical protein
VVSRPNGKPKAQGMDPGKTGRGPTTHSVGAGVTKNVPLPGFSGPRGGRG